MPATPPNAIVYGTGQVPQSTMLRCGLLLNLVCIAVIAALAWWVYGCQWFRGGPWLIMPKDSSSQSFILTVDDS